MKFSRIPSTAAAGGILAHSVRVNGRKWKKGRALTARDTRTLTESGIDSIMVAMPEAGDVAEDRAAAQVAAVFQGEGVRAAKPFTGRVNLFATRAGLLHFDAERVHRLNAISPHLTAATLPVDTPVAENELLATIKIIPFAVPETLLARAIAAPLPFAVTPFVRRRVCLIQTQTADSASSVADKTRRVTAARLAALGGSIIAETRCRHDSAELQQAIEDMQRQHAPQLLLIVGAQAVSDARDTVPAAVVAAGGELLRVGMPVDPGNLLLLAAIGDVPVIGLPGCAQSPSLNGFDWVLSRVMASPPLTLSDIAADISRWGVGGLLADTRERPLPRAQISSKARRTATVAAVLLAAGSARRMGGENKLLRCWNQRPLLLHAVSTLENASRDGLLSKIVAVTGRDAEAIAALLPPHIIRAHNPDYLSGMASSLACGICALTGMADDIDAVLVFLADMPQVEGRDIAALINTLIAADGSADIVVPEHRGKRGNPVLIHRRLFPRLLEIEGDTGARALFADVRVHTAPAGAGVLYDIDTPAAFVESAD